MIYNISYCGDSYKRLFWAVISDSRANIPAVRNMIGVVIKSYVDSQTALVNPDVLPYKIETELGVLVGYFGLYTGPGPAAVAFGQFRPAFLAFQSDINQNIATFVSSGNWSFDTLNQ